MKKSVYCFHGTQAVAYDVNFVNEYAFKYACGFENKTKNLNVICLPTEDLGVHKNSLRNVCAFQDRIGICKC